MIADCGIWIGKNIVRLCKGQSVVWTEPPAELNVSTREAFAGTFGFTTWRESAKSFYALGLILIWGVLEVGFVMIVLEYFGVETNSILHSYWEQAITWTKGHL